ncbi:hypothetical protein ACWCSH_47360, partial [Streptosporangium sp. NPDC001682]
MPRSRQTRRRHVPRAVTDALGPVPVVLEGVGRQFHPPPTRQHRTPVERYPVHMQLGQRRHD